jgi:hypothetical protein
MGMEEGYVILEGRARAIDRMDRIFSGFTGLKIR